MIFSKKCAAIILIVIIFTLLQSCSIYKDPENSSFSKGEEVIAPWGAKDLLRRRNRCMDIPGNKLEDCR